MRAAYAAQCRADGELLHGRSQPFEGRGIKLASRCIG